MALLSVIFYTLFLTVLSLMPIDEEIPRFGFSFDDKIYHLFAYFIFTVLLYTYTTAVQIKRKILVAFSIAVIYGIIIEVLQGTLGNKRTSEVYDVIANVSGSLIGVLVILSMRKLKLK